MKVPVEIIDGKMVLDLEDILKDLVVQQRMTELGWLPPLKRKPEFEDNGKRCSSKCHARTSYPFCKEYDCEHLRERVNRCPKCGYELIGAYDFLMCTNCTNDKIYNNKTGEEITDG